eukprot:TRINITY_DN26816_c0_g1_i1.p1 TRINITY_DN26816_c0_g1~~TRINITY_DN26816_c0_g1_i1.p1  ORF type:complete len:356 (+),score=93.58 TRINITY_DN26816_c0_g1_i1:235-1302(+)
MVGAAGFSAVTLQFLPPTESLWPRMARVLAAYEHARATRAAALSTAAASHGAATAPGTTAPLRGHDHGHGEYPLVFYPVMSFNLYSPRCGATLSPAPDKYGTHYVVGLGGSDQSRGMAWFESHMRKETAATAELPKLAQFFKEVKHAIVEFASHNLQISFEVRSDHFSNVTDPHTSKKVLDKLLQVCEAENPDVAFPKCASCSTIHYNIDPKNVAPLGRASLFFPNGKHIEETFFEEHVKVNEDEFLCSNWSTIDAITIDTKGYPQLCYSNLALMPKVRSTNGANLYSERGWHEVMEFFGQVQRDRISYLRDNLPALLLRRPNANYCPLLMFRSPTDPFLCKVSDGRKPCTFADW